VESEPSTRVRSLGDQGQPAVQGVERDHFPPSVAEKLHYYVYLLRDPESGEIFYVGKGTGDRVFAHARNALSSDEETPKAERIKAILCSKQTVSTELLRSGLDEDIAFEVEAAAIELCGLTTLLNLVEGHGSLSRGRMTTDDAIMELEAPPIDVTVPALLIKPSRLWYRGMPEDELFEATAVWWKLGKRRELAQYAFAVVHGVIRGVWHIEGWRPRQEGDSGWEDDPPGKPRWGFTGTPATKLNHYIGHSVAHYWKPGARLPFTYVNCPAGNADEPLASGVLPE
jgi:hypothetical protein